MMKKRWLSLALVLAFCLILIPAAAMAAEAPEVTVTVGDGTDYDDYIPSYSGYNYGKSQYVIPASELTEINGMTITGLKWYLESTSSRPARRTQIVLSEMEGTTLSGLVDVSDQPVAFAGLPVWTVGSGGEILITFNTPYEYHGGNLLVTTLDVTGDYASGNYFYGVYNDIPAYISYSDSTKYSFASTGGYSDSFLPKTTLICGDPSLAPEVPVETYGLWIAGTQVTERNAADLTQIEGVSGTAASYDPEKKTLTLDSAMISGGTYKDATVYSNIDDLEINISGSCSITTDSNYALNADENLYIKGDGTLTVTGGDMTGTESSAGIRCWALSAGGSVTVYANGGTAERISYGVYASSEVYVSGEASLIAEGGPGAASYGMYAGGGLYTYGHALVRATGGSAELDSYGVYVSGGDLRMGDQQSDDPTIILSGGSGGRSSFGLYFYQRNNYGLYYGYVYLLNQKITITGETAAVAHYFTNPPAPSLARSVPAAFVSDNADGSGLQLYKGSVKDDAGEYYKYLSTVPPEGFEAYSLWVGGTRISSMNAADILGDGKASYDPASNTLTLDGAVIQSPDGSYYENNKAVCYSGASPFTVEARGTNTLTGGGNSISYSSSYEAFQYESAGIYSSTDLTINLTDGAELSLNGGYSYTYPSYGIWGAGNLTVTGSGTANISSGTIRDGGSGDSFIGARFYGDLTMDGAADVNISSEGTALACRGERGGKNWSFLAPAWTGTLVAAGRVTSVYYYYGELFCGDGEITAYEAVDSAEGTVLTDEILSLSDLSDHYDKLVIVPYEIPDSYTATLDPKGGTVAPAQAAVSYQQPYRLPTPERDGYIFDGWYVSDYMPQDYVQTISDNRTRMLRLSPYASASSDRIPDGSIIVFDVEFASAVPISVDVNDRPVDESCYTIDGNRITGRIVMDSSLQYNYYGFLDINCDSTPYDYNVYKFMVFKRDDAKFLDGDTVTIKRPHTLYAGWAAPMRYKLTIAGTQVTSINAADVLGDGTVVYAAESNTLILDGADIRMEGTDSTEAVSTGMPDLTIELRGANTIAGHGGWSAYGIHSDGNITFKGSGTLEVTGTGANYNCGMHIYGNLTLGEEFTGTVQSAGGDVDYPYGPNSMGICCYGSQGIILDGSGTLIARSGSAGDGQTYGIRASFLSVSGSARLEATSGNATDNGNDNSVESHAILCSDDVSISEDAVVIARSGTVKGDYSFAVNAGNIQVSGGSLEAVTAGGADCEYSLGIIGSTVTVSGGTVYAEAGPAKMGYGFYGDVLNITGGSLEARTLSENGCVLQMSGDYNVTVSPAYASRNADGSGAVAYVSGDNDSYRWFAVPFKSPAPGPIETVTADAAPGRVRLSWTAAENATAYLIQRRTADSTAWTTLRSGITNTAWSDTTGAAGTVYQYRVRPMNGSVYGSFRASSVVRFLSGETPAPVENITATAQAGRIVLTWAEARNAEQYLVQRRVKDTEDWTTLRSNVTGLRYEDATGEEGVVYQYRVRGRSGTLYGPFRVSSVARFYLYETPGSISSLTAKAEGGAVTVSWTAAENAAQYIIQRRVKGDTAWTTLKSNVSDLSYVDTTGEAGVVYQYRVRGRNHTVYGPFRVSSVVRYPQPTR